MSSTVPCNQQRCQMIKARLNKAFTPDILEVLDESHKHIGHPGARSNKGHFALRIQAPALMGSKIEAHRAIYQALGELMTTEIHALSIHIVRSP